MSKHSYTSVHDLEDIFCGIYAEDKDYSVRFWNHTDRHYMKVGFRSVQEFPQADGTNRFELHLVAEKYLPNEQIMLASITTVEGWKTLLKQLHRTDEGWLEWQDAMVIIHNLNNNQTMRMYFTGSSKDPAEVNYNIDYCDPHYHWFRRWFHTQKFKINYKLNKLFKK